MCKKPSLEKKRDIVWAKPSERAGSKRFDFASIDNKKQLSMLCELEK